MHHSKVWEPSDADRLTKLESMRSRADKNKVKGKQRARAVLQQSMPTVNDAIPDVASKWVYNLLQLAPTPWHAQQLTQQQLMDAMSGAHKATKMQVLAAYELAESPWLDQTSAELDALHLHQILDTLQQAVAQEAKLLECIDEIGKEFASKDVLESVDGIGKRVAISLLTFAFRDLVPLDRDAANRLMGGSPIFDGSGQNRDGSPKGTVRMRRSAPPRARRCVYLLGRLAHRHLGWAEAMYEDGRKRGQKAATIYRRIARSLLRILTAMVRNQEPYDDARYVAALKKNGVSWAMDL
jgi:hypothetical protein